MPRTAKKQPAPVYPKLNLPTNRGQIIERPRLTAAYAAHHAIAFIAPAGAGKTTLAMQWASDYAGAVCWMALAADDNRPRNFWSFALGLLQIIAPQHFEQAALLLAQEGDRLSDRFVDALLDDLAALKQPIALVMDEAHFIQNPALVASLKRLLAGLPETGRVVFAGRSLAAGLLAHVQVVNDLSFSYEETKQALSLQHVRALDAATITRIVAATEGWAMGVKLAGLALQGNNPLPEHLTSYSVRYLMDEALRNIPAEQVDFMQRTCIVDVLTPSLCDALTGRNDSAAQLETLLGAGLFISRIKDAPPEYRYHPLFREALLEHVKQQNPQLLQEIHRRAAAWYAASGQYREAADQANASGDIILTGHYALEASKRIILFSDMFLFRDWLKNYPPELLDAQPRLRLFALMGAMQVDHDAAAAREHLQRLQERPDANHWQGEIALGIVHLGWVPGKDMSVFLPQIEEALRTLPHDALYAHAAFLASLAYEDMKDSARRLQALEEEYHVSHEFDSPEVMLHAINGLSGVLMDAARFDDVLALTQEGLAVLSANRHHWGRFAADAEGAIRTHRVTTFLQRGNVEEAAQTLRPAFEHLEQMEPAVLWRLYCRQIEVSALRQDFLTMEKSLNYALLLAPAVAPPAAGLKVITQAYYTRSKLRRHDVEAARRWLETAPDVQPESMYTTGTAHTTAHARIVVGDYARALQELDAEQQAYAARGRYSHVAQIIVLKALTYWLNNEEAAARAALDEALDLVLPAGNVLPLALTALLPLLRQRIVELWEAGADDRAEFLRQPIALMGETPPSLPLTPLTPAEQQVAHLLLQGHTIEEMANMMQGTSAGVRFLIRHLHSKLCTLNREALLARLRTLQLGDGDG